MDITVRRAEPSDAEALYRIFQGRAVVAGTLQTPYPSLTLWQERLGNPPEGLYSLVACAGEAAGQATGEAGKVVGSLTLGTNPTRPRTGHVGHIGMAVRDDWQGRGVGSELMRAALDLADNWLALTRLELHVFTDNAPAVALYEKFGFEIEGTHRRFAFRDGGFVDAYSMARITG